MLKQNLEDKCFTMANIFSFAEKIILDFKKKSEGDKFLFLYCITAKLLSNRLYDYETVEDKINCLLNRIPQEKKENNEQFKKLLNNFVLSGDFSVDKVKSFFEINKSLLSEIYENEKPSDLLFFFVQILSQYVFKDKNHKAFFKKINSLEIKNKTFQENEDSYWLGDKTVDKQSVENALQNNPDRIFNKYISKIDQDCSLSILQKDVYKTSGFKLNKRIFNKQLAVSEGKTNKKMEKNDYKSTYEYISQTLDIDKILKEKFNFKTINELSKDELKKLNLSYDEEFIYFLSGCNLGNEVYLQNKLYLKKFTAPNVPFEIIKPETTLKICSYFCVAQEDSLTKKMKSTIKNFDNPKNLFDAYDKLYSSKEELSLNKELISTLYFYDTNDEMVRIDKVFKYIDGLDAQDLKNIDQKTKDRIFDVLKTAIDKDNGVKNVQAILTKFLETTNDGGNLLFSFIISNIDAYWDKFQNHLSEIYNSYKNKNYNSTKKQKVGCVMYYLLNQLSNKLNYQGNCVKSPQVYIEMVLDLLSNNKNKFEILESASTKPTDATKHLTKILNKFIDSYLEPKVQILTEPKEDNESIVKIDDYVYDLQKIFGVFKQSYNPQNEQNVYNQNDIQVVQNQLKFCKKILNSSVVGGDTKTKIFKLAKLYLGKLEQTYNEFTYSQFQIFLSKYYPSTKVNNLSSNDKTQWISNQQKNLASDLQNLELNIETLNIKSNVTSYFKENGATWLSFLLIMPIFLYNFKWKPQYISDKNNLENNKNTLESQKKELQAFDYEQSDSGKNHNQLIGDMKKFINDENNVWEQQKPLQNNIIPERNEEDELSEEDEKRDL